MDKDEQIAFLEQQLAGAVAMLRRRDATEAEAIARLEANFRTLSDQREKTSSEIKSMYRDAAKKFGRDAMRYRLLREQWEHVKDLNAVSMELAVDRLVKEYEERTQGIRAA